MEITAREKSLKIRRIMKRTKLSKKDASMFLNLLLTNKRFAKCKNKLSAFKLAKKEGMTINDAMNLISKRRKEKQENNAMDNLIDNEYNHFDGKNFIKKNSKMLIIVGVGVFLLFTPMGKGLIKKITG
jgi:hypothetical protein